MAEVVLQRVSKRYTANGPLAVRDLDLRMGDGEFIAIVGPSGCGKTTTLRLIAGLEEPDGGAIDVAGRPTKGVSPRDRNLALVPQDAALYPHLTARQNLAFALRMRSVPRDEIERRIKHVAATLRVVDLLDRRPGSMSGGQQQRVALGRALVRLPEASIILLDEPLSNLDAANRTLMRSEIKRLHQAKPMTALYVTHDQAEAMALGDRIVVMAGGVKQQEGPPLEVYHRPANRFVAGFIGSPPMNFIDGSVSTADRRAAFIAESGERLDLGPPSLLLVHEPQQSSLGVRPEDFSIIEAQPTPGRAMLDATVQFIEPLGSSALVHVTTSGGSRIVVSALKACSVRHGQRIQVAFDPTSAHVFAHGTFGERLLAHGAR